MIVEKKRSLSDDRIAIGKCSIDALVYLAWRHKEYFTPQLPKRNKDYLTVILNDVCKVFDVDKEYVIMPKRDTKRVMIRFIYCYVAKIKTKSHLKEIGEVIGGKDHTTILYAITEAKRCIRDNDPDFMEFWDWYRSKSEVW